MKKFVFFIIFFFNGFSYSEDHSVIALMYHRFDENKYPSTNIRYNVFLKHIQLIKELGFNFIHPNDFESNFNIPKKQKKILLTIDDGFKSFYDVAWPYLKENKIPFILFVSTEPIGNQGYMTWEQLKEIDRESFAIIGHHSHTH